jgi:hypothetical protein
MAKQTDSCLVFPLGTIIAHLTGRDTSASQAEMMCGSDNGNTHLSIDIGTHDRIRLIILFSQERGQLLLHTFNFSAYEAIGGCHEQSEMTALLKI